MAHDQQTQDTRAASQPPAQPPPAPDTTAAAEAGKEEFDGLEGKKPDELTPEELRLMADTMPGEGPGD